MAAFDCGWGKLFRGSSTIAQFWKAVLERLRRSSAFNREIDSYSLPASFFESAEVALPDSISVYRGPAYYPDDQAIASYSWSNSKVSLGIGLGTFSNSSPAQLTCDLELRDWLGQFFLESEVESWFLP